MRYPVQECAIAGCLLGATQLVTAVSLNYKDSDIENTNKQVKYTNILGGVDTGSQLFQKATLVLQS